MFTDKDYAVAKTLVSNMEIPDDYGVEYDGDYLYTDCIYEAANSTADLGNFGVENGISKVVVIPEDYSWVVKVPLNGRWVIDYENSDPDDTEGDEYEYCFDSYCWASAPDDSDYCWDELLKIQDAEKAGFGKLFPHTELLEERSGKRFYIQERANPSYGFHSHSSADSLKKAEEMDPSLKFCSKEWRAAVIEHYGEQFWTDFVNWDNERREHILTDMHGANYGYRDDGSPVIFDASGFND